MRLYSDQHIGEVFDRVHAVRFPGGNERLEPGWVFAKLQGRLKPHSELGAGAEMQKHLIVVQTGMQFGIPSAAWVRLFRQFADPP
jgi:hypothetical protein